MTTETRWHRHWTVRVRSLDGVVVRALRAPLLHVTDLDRVERSPYPYAPCSRREGSCHGHRDCWTLSTLAILHRWTGLTLYYRKPDEEPGGKSDEGVLDDSRGSG